MMRQPPAGSAPAMSYAVAPDLAGVRAYVRASAAALGLADRRCDLLVLAVSELTTNTLQHTRAAGSVRVWSENGQVVCDVVDTGPMRTFGPMPAAEAIRGRGLPIVQHVADDVTAAATPEGTLVRIRMNL
jgi:serine/threonine-protein kinase RsbW